MLVCALLIGAPFAAAQRPGQISVRFTVFAARPIDGLSYLSSTGAQLPLKFNPASRSTHHTYNGASPVRFVDTATGTLVAEASIPPDLREPLLLFSELATPGPRGLRYQISVLDDSAAKLSAGHLAILNLSGLKFTARLDQSEFAVAEGLNAPVPFKRETRLTLFTNVRGARVQSYADLIKPPKSARLLLILFPPARKGAVEVQTRALSDDPPPPFTPGVRK